MFFSEKPSQHTSHPEKNAALYGSCLDGYNIRTETNSFTGAHCIVSWRQCM